MTISQEFDISHAFLAAIRRLAAVLLFAAVSLFAGCTPTAPAARFVVQADRLHNSALDTTLITDPDLNDYLQEVANRIAAAALQVAPAKANADFLKRVHVHLVNSDTINVVGTGGTHLYVFNGLFQQCQNEDDLAVAMAHAYAHLVNLDLESAHIRPDDERPLASVVWDFVVNRFTLDQEKRADQLAMALYARGGWDPIRSTNLFERLEGITGGNVAPDRESLPARISLVQAAALNAPRTPRVLPVADPKTFLSLRKRAGQFHEPTPPTASLIFLRAFPNCLLSADTQQQKEAQERLRPLPPPPPQGHEPN